MGVYQCLVFWYSCSQIEISDYVGVSTIVHSLRGLADCPADSVCEPSI